MPDEIRLVLRAVPERGLEAAVVAPDRLAAMSESAIASLPLSSARQVGRLGDWFDVRASSGHATRVRVEGERAALARLHGLGTAMRGGELVIEGGAGERTGYRMAGGMLTVRGDVGDDAGVGMSGGVIMVEGDAGDRLGSAPAGGARGMTGGEIIVRGNAGSQAAALVRRGLVAVGGRVADGAATSMVAGTLVALGGVGRSPGRWMKRGTIATVGEVEIPRSYRYACTYRPPHLALLLTYLRQRHALPVSARQPGGRWRRYSGDLSELGKGEILAWTADSRA